MHNKTPVEIAQLFSEGKFAEVEDYLSAEIEWNIYEEKKVLSGKTSVLNFTKKVGEYFRSITTKFETFGLLEDGNKVAIYGRTEFFRGSKSINILYSCDVYIFNGFGNIQKIHSYCNSNRIPQLFS